jgi:hypothetical protein
MSLWMVIVLLGLVKLPVAALMLWIPFRDDQAMKVGAANVAGGVDADEAGDSEDDDGGSIALGACPRDPHPRSPLPRPRRRGPHGSGVPPSPRRLRRPAVSARLGSTPARARERATAARRGRSQRLRLR